MRDRFVLFYLLIVLAQLPFYFIKGKEPLGFDFSMQSAERKLRSREFRKEEEQQAKASLEKSRQHLRAMGDETSRWALVAHEEGVLAWKLGHTKAALEHFEEARTIFQEKHGPDSFHAHAVNLRIAELELLRGETEKALVRFEQSVPSAEAYLGARAPFPVRMKFRLITCLVAVERLPEAARLTTQSLSDLRSVAPEQDTAFLNRTGAALDTLQMRGFLQKPASSYAGWTSLLLEQAKAGSEASQGEES